MINLQVIQGPRLTFAAGSFYSELIRYAVRGLPGKGESSQPDLTVLVGSPQVGASARLASALDSALARRRGRHSRPLTSLLDRRSRGRSGDAPALWFTGENIRPPVTGDWSASFSFDIDPLGGLNEYLPIWWGDVDLLPGYKSLNWPRIGRPMLLQDMVSHREANIQARPKFVCAFINNPEPMRMHYVKLLSTLGRVNVFGRASGIGVPNKLEVAKDYRFMLCFENDVYPGYITEKAFEAWHCGCIPLWRGLDPGESINPAAVVNAASISSESFLQRVDRLNTNQEEWSWTAGQPILQSIPDLRPAVTRIQDAISPFLA